MEDKYLSIITNFGCHYSCPECVVRNNHLKMRMTKEDSCGNELCEGIIKSKANWVSVSGGGDPLYNWTNHQKWWSDFFRICHTMKCKTELHTSYCKCDDSNMCLFPFDKFNRVVYHVHSIEDLFWITRHGHEIVRAVFVVDEKMTKDSIRKISDYVNSHSAIDELSFRQYVDENYKPAYYLHDFLKSGHKKDWWYIEQNDYNVYYHNGRLYYTYKDIFD